MSNQAMYAVPMSYRLAYRKHVPCYQARHVEAARIAHACQDVRRDIPGVRGYDALRQAERDAYCASLRLAYYQAQIASLTAGDYYA